MLAYSEEEDMTTFNIVFADIDGKLQRVFTPEGGKFYWDASKKMNLARAEEIFEKIKKVTGKNISVMHLSESTFTGGVDDCESQMVRNVEYKYYSKHRELRKYKNGDIVSVFDKKGACTDYATLKDSGY
jgi:hypothetical protein